MTCHEGRLARSATQPPAEAAVHQVKYIPRDAGAVKSASRHMAPGKAPPPPPPPPARQVGATGARLPVVGWCRAGSYKFFQMLQLQPLGQTVARLAPAQASIAEPEAALLLQDTDCNLPGS